MLMWTNTHKACKEENKLVELIQLNGAWMGGTSTTPCLCIFFVLSFLLFSFFLLSFCQVLADSLEGSSILAMSSAQTAFLPSPMDSPYRCMNGALLHALLWFLIGRCFGSCKYNVHWATFLCDNQGGIIVLVWDHVRIHFASCTV